MISGISRRKKRKLKSDINVVPYIDVMLVLLIIFMVTAPLLTLSTDVSLPSSRAKALESKQDPVVVVVAADGKLALQLPKGKPQAMDVAALQAQLAAIVAQDKDARVVVAGDRAASYQKIMDAIDVLKQAKVEKVGLISDSGGTAGSDAR
ncbi:protein TolR [Xanthomonas prunicola]|jgi:biopolymer transport protein TolR|uniref:Tol-Pal system protein TolR n=1 Tax=Xanthomonas prunicola TaxID=2053930 RepID=A0A9Q9MKY0_9XANT|nr:protein TolR [Xanthomonas prunicola]USI99554.1 protein TolR [Xanthomonas prunicola]UXA48007.1 protein TolR [Xanthomonas prunicola]UXA54155.1 protein TolR [Xanthomonas prunicola]UXA56472.1 protein TolR [Xanthomonas prunicola]UXA62429.1 protein TolR [Xanthomonas prunicola]